MQPADLLINKPLRIHYINELQGVSNDVIIRKGDNLDPCIQHRFVVWVAYRPAYIQ